jgi:DNA-binding HxlR family transcriptional regulator
MQSILMLSRYRWTLPVIAELAARGGSRFVPLAHGLGLSRDTLRQTLDALIESGLVVPNVGYGHPSRPEYLLTDRGRALAPACTQLLAHLRRSGLEDVALRKWSLPILAALGAERRYGDLRRSVGATSRALTLALKLLVAAGLVERRVHDGFPPSTTYRPTARSRTVQRWLGRIAEAL